MEVSHTVDLASVLIEFAVGWLALNIFGKSFRSHATVVE